MTNYPYGIDNSITLPAASGSDAVSINAVIAATEAIENELGVLPSGIYATVRARLDILESRINNPFGPPSPTVENPFTIGLSGVTIQADFGDPNTLDILGTPGSLYLRQDGYDNNGLYTYSPDGYWAAISASAGGTAGGDLSGGYPNPTVVRLQGNPISNVGPANGQVLTWNSVANNWQPQSISSGSVTLIGDVTGPATSNSVVKINGTSVPNAPSANQVLVATSGTASTWEQISNAQISTSAAIDGSKITPAFGSQNVSTTGTLSAGATTVSSLQDTSLGSTGVVHNNSSGNFTSSLIVNADIAATGTANIAVGKLAAGTAAQILLNNSTPSPTWTSITGDVSLTNAGVAEVIGILSKNLPSLTDGYLNYTGAAWEFSVLPSTLPPSGTAGGDLTGTYPNPVVARAQNGDIIFNTTSIEFATTVINPLVYQANDTTNSSTANSLTVQAQNATGTSSFGGALNLSSGSGTLIDGYVNIQVGGITQISIDENIIQLTNTGTLLTGNVAISGSSGVPAGIVTINNGSPTVSGGLFSNFTTLAAGIIIRFSTQPSIDYFIQSIASNSSLTLTTNYTGTNSTTASITNYPNQLYGVGTLFTEQLVPGAVININTVATPYVVASIQSNTQLTLTTNYNSSAPTSITAVTATAVYVPTILQSPQTTDTQTTNLAIVGQSAFSGAITNTFGGNIALIPGAPTSGSSTGGSVIVSLYPLDNIFAAAPQSSSYSGQSAAFMVNNATLFSAVAPSTAFAVMPYGDAGECRVYIGGYASEYLDAIQGKLEISAGSLLSLVNNGTVEMECRPFSNNITTDFQNIMLHTSLQFSSIDGNSVIAINTPTIHNVLRPLQFISQTAYQSNTFSPNGLGYINNGSATFNGTGTFFSGQLINGQIITISGVNYTILNIISISQLTLTIPYAGTTINSPGIAFSANSFLTNGAPLELMGGAATVNGSVGLRGGIKLQLGADINETLVEIAEPVIGQRVVALGQISSGITSTQMPTNTGDGVIWVGNAHTNPTAPPTGGFILYSNGGNPYLYTSGGVNVPISLTPSGVTWADDLSGSTDFDQYVVQITGTGTNEFTSDGYKINILATESVLGSGTTNKVKGAVGGAITTDGSTWVSIFSYTPGNNTGKDWLISLIGLDLTSTSPIDGYFYRSDLQFTTIRVGSGAPIIYPSPPIASNVQSNGPGSGYSVQVIVVSNTIDVQVRGVALTTVHWSGSVQTMEVS